jgi:hypothetical protein
MSTMFVRKFDCNTEHPQGIGTGGNDRYKLCNGEAHFQVVVGLGQYAGSNLASEIGTCDNDGCRDGEFISVEELPREAQRYLALPLVVPHRTLLVVTGQSGFQVYRSAAEVLPADWNTGTLLKPGEQLRVFDGMGVPKIVKNLNGRKLVCSDPADRARENNARRAYCTKQFEKLIEGGLTQSQAGKLTKMLGPSLPAEALRLAKLSLTNRSDQALAKFELLKRRASSLVYVPVAEIRQLARDAGLGEVPVSDWNLNLVIRGAWQVR